MAKKKAPAAGAYKKIIERIFLSRYKAGDLEVVFEREDIVRTASEIGAKLPKNLGDLVYSFRYRAEMPESVTSKAPKGHEWIIEPAGTARYRFVAAKVARIVPNEAMAETKVPDSTPGVIVRYALTDEQALLAKLRYNRLIDIFTGVACYSLQSHLRTQVPEVGQVETDEVYIGVDRRGVHYAFPVQAKGHADKLSVVQIDQDFKMSAKKFPAVVCRPIGAQFMSGDLIALFEFEKRGDGAIQVTEEKHYRLVPSDQLSDDELRAYAERRR